MRKMRAFVMLAVLMSFAVGAAACASSSERRSAGKYIDDKTISAKVKTDLLTDPVTKASEITVNTYNGVVQLSGFVSNQESIKRAEDIARNVKGVRAVENNLVLRSETAPSGGAATAP